ncbi:hypothetical protein AAG570_008331 [Ranatra chinensis]|uniref:Uncharacterized protein n=1 Tax=Ranatra chinensis TaxID=642074 RepID=A0ABD0YBG9_9HEMI
MASKKHVLREQEAGDDGNSGKCSKLNPSDAKNILAQFLPETMFAKSYMDKGIELWGTAKNSTTDQSPSHYPVYSPDIQSQKGGELNVPISVVSPLKTVITHGAEDGVQAPKHVPQELPQLPLIIPIRILVVSTIRNWNVLFYTKTVSLQELSWEKALAYGPEEEGAILYEANVFYVGVAVWVAQAEDGVQEPKHVLQELETGDDGNRYKQFPTLLREKGVGDSF